MADIYIVIRAKILRNETMKYKNESTMPGPGDQITWKPCTGNPLDPRTEEPDDDFLDKSDPREMENYDNTR
jgi:hypothetical protein